MNFKRFTQYGTLSNWGWYSNDEKALLKKEDELVKYFRSLEPFMKKNSDLLGLFMDFMAIRLDNAIETAQIPHVSAELDRIEAAVKELRLTRLDLGGDDVPEPTKLFENHQPAALAGEIRTYLQYRKTNAKVVGNGSDAHYETDPPFKVGFVIHLNDQTREQFKSIIDTGCKVLWALDENDILSIGDPKSTKHSVVAVGKKVWGAGIAQLEIDSRLDAYLAMVSERERALDMRNKASDATGKTKEEYEDNAKYLEQKADEYEQGLDGWQPPNEGGRPDTVVLDFDSGHYTPSGAWKAAQRAWSDVGYKVKWSRDARHV